MDNIFSPDLITVNWELPHNTPWFEMQHEKKNTNPIFYKNQHRYQFQAALKQVFE